MLKDLVLLDIIVCLCLLLNFAYKAPALSQIGR